MRSLFEFNGRNYFYMDGASELSDISIADNCFVLIMNSENETGKFEAIDFLTSNSAGAIAFIGRNAHAHIPKLLKNYDEKWEAIGLLPYLFDGLKLIEAMERVKCVFMPTENKLDDWTSTFVLEIGEPKIGYETVKQACL